MPKTAVIISALGKGSFTSEQVVRMENHLDITFYAQLTPISQAEFIARAKPAQILAVTRRPIKDIPDEIICSLPKLEGLAIYSTGYEWVDVEALDRCGIVLSYLPDYSMVSVAEHTIGAMLVMSRRIHLSYDKSRGMIADNVSLRGWELRAKNLGLIGLGRIGKEVARLAGCFGMKVHYYDPQRKDVPGACYLPMEELLRTMDFIVITCSKQRNAPPVIGARELSLLKKGAFIINTARADLVDPQAVIEAIIEKRLAGYAVDDTQEIFNHPSIEPGRILQTGHTAWYSMEAIQRGTETWVNNIIALALDKPENAVGRSRENESD